MLLFIISLILSPFTLIAIVPVVVCFELDSNLKSALAVRPSFFRLAFNALSLRSKSNVTESYE